MPWTVPAVARLVDAADGREVTFHRALDTVPYLEPALDDLVALGIARVLTSGGAARSIDGLDRLATAVGHSARRLQVMAGGGVRPADIPALVAVGVDAVHLSASRHVDESGGPGGGSDGYTTTDPALVTAAVAGTRPWSGCAVDTHVPHVTARPQMPWTASSRPVLIAARSAA